MVVAVELIETVGVTGVVTLNVITLLVDVAVVKHVALLVIIQLTLLPFANVLFVYVALFVPTGEPFSNHW